MILTLKNRDKEQNPRQLRAAGAIPATVYGKSLAESLSFQLTKLEYKDLGLAHYIQLLDAQDETGKQKFTLLIKSIEKHPLSGEVLNIQFHQVDPTQKVIIEVPIEYFGSSPAVQAGGILFLNKKKVKVQCAAKDIPASIKFDLNKLNKDAVLATYADLPIDGNLELKSDAKQIIAKVSLPKTADAETSAA